MRQQSSNQLILLSQLFIFLVQHFILLAHFALQACKFLTLKTLELLGLAAQLHLELRYSIIDKKSWRLRHR